MRLFGGFLWASFLRRLPSIPLSRRVAPALRVRMEIAEYVEFPDKRDPSNALPPLSSRVAFNLLNNCFSIATSCNFLRPAYLFDLSSQFLGRAYPKLSDLTVRHLSTIDFEVVLPQTFPELLSISNLLFRLEVLSQFATRATTL